MVISNSNGHIKYLTWRILLHSTSIYGKLNVDKMQVLKRARIETSFTNWSIFAVAQKHKHISMIIPTCYPISKKYYSSYGAMANRERKKKHIGILGTSHKHAGTLYKTRTPHIRCVQTTYYIMSSTGNTLVSI